jgi:hypothetical protein
MRRRASASASGGAAELTELLVGTADHAVVAPAAGALGRSSRQERLAQRLADHLRDAGRAGARIRVEGDRPLLEAAGRGAVVEPAGLDRELREELLDGESVEHRLQRLAPGHDLPGLHAHLAGLVVGHAGAPVPAALHQVDGAAQGDAAVEVHRLVPGVGIAVAPAQQPEGELEEPRREAGLVQALPAQPLAQVGAHRLDPVAPDPVDGRSQVVLVALRRLVQDPVEVDARRLEALRRQRQQALVPQHPEERELHVVHHRAALQRRDLLDRLRHLPRRQPMHRVEEELVGTGREVLERRGREAAGGEPVAGDGLTGRLGGLHQAIGHHPVAVPAARAEAQRAAQARVGGEQVARGANAALRVPALQRLEQRQVVLGLVDRPRRVLGCRPADARRGDALGLPRQLVEAGQASGGRAQGLERVEGRHPRARAVQIEPGVGEHQLTAGGAHCDAQHAPLAHHPPLVGREVAESLAHAIQQDGLLLELLREELLGQARHEHHVEGEPPRPQLEQTLGDHQLHLVETHRTDRRHGRELRQHREHPGRSPQGARRQRRQAVEPLAPHGAGRQRRQVLEQRQGVVAQRVERRQVALDARGRGIVRVLERLEVQGQLGRQAVEPPRPAVAPADHRRVDQQLLPAARRAQGAVAHRRLGRAVDGVGLLLRARLAQGLGDRPRHHLLVRRHPALRGLRGCGRLAGRVGVRHLGERQVLGEAPGREVLGGAGEQRREGAPRRVRRHRAAGEVGGHAGPPQRLDQVGAVLLRRAQQDGDAVEGDALVGQRVDASSQLDALAALAGRGDHGDLATGRRGRRRASLEEVGLQGGQRLGSVPHRKQLGLRSERPRERLLALVVAPGQGGQQLGGATRQRLEQLALRPRGDLEVEQQGRQPEPGVGGVLLGAPAGQGVHARAVGQPRLGQRLLVGRSDALELGRLLRECGLRRARQAHLLERTRQRAHQPRSSARALEATELAALADGVDDPRHQRLADQRAHRDRALPGQLLGGEHRRQPCEGGAVPAERRAALAGGLAQQLVGGGRRRRDHQHLLGRRACEQPLARVVEPNAGRGRDDRPGGHGGMLHAGPGGFPTRGRTRSRKSPNRVRTPRRAAEGGGPGWRSPAHSVASTPERPACYASR